jgi:hypothetical protein
LCQNCSLLSKIGEENNVDWKALEERNAFLERVITGDMGDVAMITAESTLLKGLKEDYIQGCFNQWKRRWDKCTASEGDCFEGNKNDVPDTT